MWGDLTGTFKFNVTSEMIFIFPIILNRNEMSSYLTHLVFIDVVLFWLINDASSYYRCDGAALACHGQEDAEPDPSEKLQDGLWCGLMAVSSCQDAWVASSLNSIIMNKSSMFSQSHFTVDRTLSRMSATIDSSLCITLSSEIVGLFRPPSSTARLLYCQ